MVSGKTNVFTIASWNREANRINSYAYVFMNLETRHAYKSLFERLFQVLSDVGRKPVWWAYQLGANDSAEGIRTDLVIILRRWIHVGHGKSIYNEC
ncbi:hypothetical protein N7532_012151 [Penicillium argentinense]|uniref:Uncharacterized protein n=1 Tax=Penicillium argentinense TaxID=1131581 RepID=A0A9W9EJU3_9EURO|nr:uncharacterized protein N7532_012151 [Penicillium argentinense]KAJ5083108.1 hypothetical protein N7532_012151 [Penicillium argentinense]